MCCLPCKLFGSSLRLLPTSTRKEDKKLAPFFKDCGILTPLLVLAAKLDAGLLSLKSKQSPVFTGQQLAFVNSQVIISLVHRLVLNCLVDLQCMGIKPLCDIKDNYSLLPKVGFQAGVKQAEPMHPWRDQFSLVLLGSLARLEASPYSDVELLVVVDFDKSTEAESKSSSSLSLPQAANSALCIGLSLLVQLLQLKFAALGETCKGDEEFCPDLHSRKGFSFDTKLGSTLSSGNECCVLDA